jgi:hypothetical protein
VFLDLYSLDTAACALSAYVRNCCNQAITLTTTGFGLTRGQ